MKQIIGFVLFLVLCFARSQTVNNVRVVNHIDYILKVLQDTVSEVEHRQWCNLKLPEISVPINEIVIDRHYEGTVNYTNGFVVSIQQVDILRSSVQQIWSWNSAQMTGTVVLQGTWRMTELAIGYDVEVQLADGVHRYTAIFSHPLVSFEFRIHYSIEKEVIDNIIVTGIVPRVTTRIPDIFPRDRTSDVLTSLFVPDDTAAGIMAWGPDVFQPIITSVVARTELPRICYDCPA